jgi:FkbM family methyltransferase
MTRAEDIVVRIVQSVLGHIERVTFNDVAQVAQQLAFPPNSREPVALAVFCQQFLNAYKNWNYDGRSNGELWLLSRIATFRPSVVFDVGANVGGWLALARNLFPGAQFHAFEIIEATFIKLQERFAGSTELFLNNFGLSDQSGSINMHLFDASNMFTSHVAYPHGSYRKVVCPTLRGDRYMEEKGIERIDFLKIDVEGAEHLVLKGFGAAVDSGQVEVIQFEYGKVNIITHFLLRDFYELLEQRGYSVGKLFPDHVDFRPYVLEDEDFLGPNFVAVRKMRPDIINSLRRQ